MCAQLQFNPIYVRHKSLQLKEKESYGARYGPLRNESHLLEKPIRPDNVSNVGIYLPRLTCRI